MLCNGPEAEVSEELCEGGGLVVGVEAAGVGENPGMAAAERGLLEADAGVFDAGDDAVGADADEGDDGGAPYPLGMNPGTPVSTTELNLTPNLIPSLISRTASSGRVETPKFSLIRLGVFEVVRRAVPRWIAQASKTCAGVLLTRLAIAVMTGSSSNLGSLLCPSAANACSTMPFFLQ